MEYLEIVDGQGRRRHIKLDRGRYLIGREASCDICLPHPNVSRRHATKSTDMAFREGKACDDRYVHLASALQLT